jgi:hypothetical protein
MHAPSLAALLCLCLHEAHSGGSGSASWLEEAEVLGHAMRDAADNTLAPAQQQLDAPGAAARAWALLAAAYRSQGGVKINCGSKQYCLH